MSRRTLIKVGTVMGHRRTIGPVIQSRTKKGEALVRTRCTCGRVDYLSAYRFIRGTAQLCPCERGRKRFKLPWSDKQREFVIRVMARLRRKPTYMTVRAIGEIWKVSKAWVSVQTTRAGRS